MRLTQLLYWRGKPGNTIAVKLTQEQGMPFELVADPFYSTANMERLKNAIADVETGKATLKQHDLIEVK